MEQRTNREPARLAHGDVLIGGLGLGMLPHALARKAAVTSIRVIEINTSVMALVGPHLHNGLTPEERAKITIEQGDVRTWAKAHPEAAFDYIWLDIWPEISLSNIKDIQRLQRRYRRLLRDGGAIGSWVYHDLRRMRRMQRLPQRRSRRVG
jgi:spermidine synthase